MTVCGGAATTTSSTPAARAVTAPITTDDGYGARPPGAYTAARATGTSRSRTDWPCSSTTSVSRSSPAAATAETLATAISRPRRTSGARASSAAVRRSAGTRKGPSAAAEAPPEGPPAAAADAPPPASASHSDSPGPLASPPNLRSHSRTAASPPSRTLSTISRTSAATDSAAGTSARTSAATAAASSTLQLRRIADPREQLVDLGGLELVGDRVRDQPRGRGPDLLADDEPVLLQRRPRRGQVDDALDQPGQRRELDRALDLDDLGLAARALEVGGGDPRVLRRHAHAPQAPQRLRGRVLPRDRREDHDAAAVAEVGELVPLALALPRQHVLARDAEIGGARLDV